MGAGPSQQGSGCIPNKLKLNLHLHFPLFSPNRESTVESSARPSFHDLNDSSTESTDMAARGKLYVSNNSPIAPRNKRSFKSF